MAKIDGDTIKAFFINHGEKIGVGVVAATAAFLLYSGFSKPTFEDSKTPQSLQEIATRARSSIDQPHWEAIEADRPFPINFENKASQAQRPIQPKPYQIIPLKPVNEKNNILRDDPKLYPPEQVRVVAMLSALSMRTTSPSPLDALEAAEPIKQEESKKKPPKPPRRSAMSPEMMSPDMMSAEMMSPDMMAGAGMMMEGAGMGVPTTRQLNPKYVEGFRSSLFMGAGGMNMGDAGMMPGAGVMPGGAASVAAQTKVAPQTGWFIAGSALVPDKKLQEEYQRAFSEAQGYKPERDSPLYVNIMIQRADVTGRSAAVLQEKDWALVHSTGSLKKMTESWEGPVPDPVLPYFKQDLMTLPLPPVLMKDYAKIADHPGLPKEFQPIKVVESASQTEVDAGPVDASDAPTIDPTKLRSTQPGAYGGAYGEGGYAGMEAGMEYGYGQGVGMGQPSTVAVIPDHKLIRFYDFFDASNPRSIRPNRQYVYRVCFQVQDPNFPSDPRTEPSPKHLLPEVLTRVDKLKMKEKAKQPREWYRTSEWSAPSEAVELPGMQEFFAGPVVPLKTSPVGPRKIDVERSPPSGKALALRWNFTYATYVPAPVDVVRGSVIDRAATAEVVHPMSLAIKKLPPEKGGALKTGATVLDFAGGDQLGIDAKDTKMVSPGMMLMFDPMGGLKVLDEIDSSWEFRKNTYAEDQEGASAPPPAFYDPSMMPMGAGA